MAAKNTVAGAVPFFLGAGSYRHHVPAAVDHLIQRGEFLTSYTPYQPELAQGTLQYLFEFQTQVALLTSMEVANASLYDGATACAEAVAMAGRVTRRNKAVLSGGLHPHYRSVCETYARFSGEQIEAQDPAPGGGEDLATLIDGDIVLRITDDGVGIEPERVSEVLAGAGGGIGVSNVDSRLRATFGERYALRIESELGAGTTTVMTVPHLRGEITSRELAARPDLAWLV